MSIYDVDPSYAEWFYNQSLHFDHLVSRRMKDFAPNDHYFSTTN